MKGNKVESIDDFSKKYFGKASDEFGVKYKVGSENSYPSGYMFDKKHELLYRLKAGKKIYINGMHEPSLFEKNTIWISQKLLSSDQQLFRTLGHELIHGWHGSITSIWNKGPGYSNLTESVAHNWSLHQGLSLGVNVSSSTKYFHSFYSKLNISQIVKYNNRYHWHLNSIFNGYK